MRDDNLLGFSEDDPLAWGLGRDDRFLIPAQEGWEGDVFECCHRLGLSLLDRLMFARPELTILLLRDALHLTEAVARAGFERISERQLRQIHVALVTRLVLDRVNEARVVPPLPSVSRAQLEAVRRFNHEGTWPADHGRLERALGRATLGRMALGDVLVVLVGSLVGWDAKQGQRLLGAPAPLCGEWFREGRRAYACTFLQVCEALEFRMGGQPPERFSLN
jgi:hypothetical protein